MGADYRTITLDIAIQAVRAYNTDAYYSASKGLDLDRRARQLFTNSLARTRDGILEQVHFIGKDYGGVAGFKAALSLAPAIAGDIYIVREQYWDLAKSALPLRQAPSSIRVISELFAPFCEATSWEEQMADLAAKFWHFLNPDAFPVEDSRVDKFFGLVQTNSSQKYVTLLGRFREFDLAHQSWLPQLRKVDSGHAWCDNKLWDKVCYGVVEVESRRCS